MPDVDNVIADPARDITYVVKAYRRLTREEMVAAVRAFHLKNRKKLKPGQTVTIVSLIGSRG